jgi:hypothetical protein
MQAQNSQCTPLCRNRVAMLQIQPEEMASYINPALFSGVAYYVVKSDFLTISSPNGGSCNIVWDILWHLGTMICKQNSWSKHFYERMFIGRYDWSMVRMVRRVPSNREIQATLIRERSGWMMTYQPEIRSFVGDSPYWPSQFSQKDIAWRWFLASGRLLRLLYGTACRLQDQTAGTGSNLNQISVIARKFQESRILVNRVSSWILNLMGLILPVWSI